MFLFAVVCHGALERSDVRDGLKFFLIQPFKVFVFNHFPLSSLPNTMMSCE